MSSFCFFFCSCSHRTPEELGVLGLIIVLVKTWFEALYWDTAVFGLTSEWYFYKDNIRKELRFFYILVQKEQVKTSCNQDLFRHDKISRLICYKKFIQPLWLPCCCCSEQVLKLWSEAFMLIEKSVKIVKRLKSKQLSWHESSKKKQGWIWVTKASIYWLSYRCHKLAPFMEHLKSLWSCLRALTPLCYQALSFECVFGTLSNSWSKIFPAFKSNKLIFHLKRVQEIHILNVNCSMPHVASDTSVTTLLYLCYAIQKHKSVRNGL